MQLIHSIKVHFCCPLIWETLHVLWLVKITKVRPEPKMKKKNKKMSFTVIKVPFCTLHVPSMYPPRTLPVPSPYPPPAKERSWDNVTSLICKKICNDLNGWSFCRFLILYVVNPWADSAKLRDDVGLFWNARITSNRSEISAVAWRVLAPNYQTWLGSPFWKSVSCDFNLRHWRLMRSARDTA